MTLKMATSVNYIFHQSLVIQILYNTVQFICNTKLRTCGTNVRNKINFDAFFIADMLHQSW